MQKKLIAVHVCAAYFGGVRKEIQPGDPIPDDIEPQALADLIRLKAVKEEEEIEAQVILTQSQGEEASDVAVADVLAAPVASTEPAAPLVQPDAGQLAAADLGLAAKDLVPADAPATPSDAASLDAAAAPADEAAPAEPAKKSARQPKA